MRDRGDVPPKTVGVELREEGVAVEYLDGRVTLYRGVPRPVAESVTIPPETAVHLLVTDPSETEGVLMYVNDLKTGDAILEDTGVGRVLLREGDREEVFPGVTVGRRPDERTVVEADLDVTRGRVFVFAEDDWTDRRYEFVPPEDVPDDRETDPDRETDAHRQIDAGHESTEDGTDHADENASERRTDDEVNTDDESDGWIDDPAVREEEP